MGGGRKENKRRQRRGGKTVGFAFSFGAERIEGWLVGERGSTEGGALKTVE